MRAAQDAFRASAPSKGCLAPLECALLGDGAHGHADIYEARQFVESGGLLSYGQVWRENFETAANEVWKGYSSGRVFLSRNQLPQRMFSTDPLLRRIL
jgi:hypothetical protein